ncbi:MAG TPA: pantoate--beta-alanine ligase [Bacteroidales bacterium]|nr:pantoate--beta-alanine ligase [Bacteroidales bacterium]HPT20412.1 pantoate--beta-alanine ligase [Bacteroidales bacterium]
MKTISTIVELQKQIRNLHFTPVGYVATMGALHEGHLSLVTRAVKQCPLVVISIFVNPTQFNDKNDLKNYPRTIDDDLKLLSKVLRETDIVFTPDEKEMYPEKDEREFHFGNLEKVMEAPLRPGHFNGVAQVVSKFFDIIKPDIAFFGQKDFQQVAVIRELVRQTRIKTTIVACPIIREKDGLAMSSRNRLLEPEIRKEASIIFKTISQASSMFAEKEIPEIKSFVRNSINKVKGFNVEYFEIVDDTELVPVVSKTDLKEGKRYFGCIALQAGKIRLIDNIEMGLV